MKFSDRIQHLCEASTYTIKTAPIDGVTGRGQTMYRAESKGGETSGQYGKGQYLSDSKDGAKLFMAGNRKIAEYQVKHPKVLHVYETSDSDDANVEMLRAICEFVKVDAHSWNQLNTNLKNKGYGGIYFHYQNGGEFLGYGGHLV